MTGEAGVRTVATLVRGRYLVRRPDGDPTALLLGFHGYGEGAESVMEVLTRLARERPWALVAPQALHPFYRKDGQVVASWMTRLDRELAIEDNVAYVRRVVAEVSRELVSPPPLACVGFSQGVAMAWRCAAAGGFPCHAVVALAGDLPPELRNGRHPLPPALIGRGSEEEWYTEEKLAADLEALGRRRVEVAVEQFAGGHEWTESFVQRAREFLDQRLG